MITSTHTHRVRASHGRAMSATHELPDVLGEIMPIIELVRHTLAEITVTHPDPHEADLLIDGCALALGRVLPDLQRVHDHLADSPLTDGER